MEELKKIKIFNTDVLVNPEHFDSLIDELDSHGLEYETGDEWISVKKREPFLYYNARTFVEHAERYLTSDPPDVIQAAEKLWFSIVFAVKALYLSQMIDLKSHASLKYFTTEAMLISGFDARTQHQLIAILNTGEGCDSSVYGGAMLSKEEFTKAVSDAKIFIEKVEQIDGSKLYEMFLKNFVESTKENVGVKKQITEVKLGGTKYKVKYSAFIK